MVPAIPQLHGRPWSRAYYRVTALLIAQCLSACVGRSEEAAMSSASLTHSDIPLVIPHPQHVQVGVGAIVHVAASGGVGPRIEMPEPSGFFIEARDLVLAVLREHAIQPADTSGVAICFTTDREGTGLDLEEREALDRSKQAYVLRVEAGPQPSILIVGASPVGVYYGATTLVQLFEFEDGKGTVRPIAIRDWPDIETREVSEWLIKWWEVNCYDWGDGLAAFIARCKRKIDLYARHKVNMIGFMSGKCRPFWKERYEMMLRYAPELSDYAARKGVALQYTYTTWPGQIHDWGVGWGRQWMETREYYPDGPLLAPTVASETSLSYDPQTEYIAQELAGIIRDTHARAVYLHHVDSTLRHYMRYWVDRGEVDRRNFPSDEAVDPQGLAGALAHFLNTLIPRLKEVRIPEIGYDASRDLSITVAAVVYGGFKFSTEQFDREVAAFWKTVASRLTPETKKNLHVCIREASLRTDRQELLPTYMAKQLDEAGWAGGLSMMTLWGSGFDWAHRIMVSTPVFVGINRGAGEYWSFNGHVHSDVLVLANANYAWNVDAPGAIDPMQFQGHALRDEVFEYAYGRRDSEFLYGRFLDQACRRVYGRRAGVHMARLLRYERDHGALDNIAVLDKWFSHGSEKHLMRYDYRAQARRNREALPMALAAAEVAETDGAREDCRFLADCLAVGARICDLYDYVYNTAIAFPDASLKDNAHECKKRLDEAHSRVDELLQWVKDSYPHQKTEPDGGVPGVWIKTIENLRETSRLALEGHVTRIDAKTSVVVSSEHPGYAAASVFTSDPTGKGWGKDGGWCDRTRGAFPDTLEIRFEEPRQLDVIDFFTLSDDWKTLPEVTRETPIGELGLRSFDFEARDAADGNWILVKSMRDNTKVWVSLECVDRPVTGVRFIGRKSLYGYSTIVHLDLEGAYSKGLRQGLAGKARSDAQPGVPEPLPEADRANPFDRRSTRR